MRSTIDWNEIVPKLKKELQDTLYLEAVILLSGAPARRAPPPALKKEVRRASSAATTNLPRLWRVKGDGHNLAAIGRHYRINRKAASQPGNGLIGAVWQKLLDCKNDVIAYEGVASICKGEKAKTSAIIGRLWERELIDIIPAPEKKVAVAY